MRNKQSYGLTPLHGAEAAIHPFWRTASAWFMGDDRWTNCEKLAYGRSETQLALAKQSNRSNGSSRLSKLAVRLAMDQRLSRPAHLHAITRGQC
jgi:hypothetical protein